MLTFSSLYPKIDINDTFYEDVDCRIGVNTNHSYLISKLDSTIIVFDKTYSKIMTFIDLILVDKLRYNSLKRLYSEIGEDNGSGSSKTPASQIRFSLENIGSVVNATYHPSLEEIHRSDIELLKIAYKNDCCTHLSSDISWQIKHFMKYIRTYDVRIHEALFSDGLKNYLIIVDEDHEIIYESILHNGILYFSDPKREKPLKYRLVDINFNSFTYKYYVSLSGNILHSLVFGNVSMEVYYDILLKEYTINYKQETIDEDNVNFITVPKKLVQSEYNEDFIFDFIFENYIINFPRYSFIEKLVELSILEENSPLTFEHVTTYEMMLI